MSDDLQGLVSLITTMHSEQNQASQRTDEHLSHLRDTMHKLANDMVGVSQLTGIMHSEVSELKKKQSVDISEVHGHIDRETKELSIKIDAIEGKISVIAPKAESFGKLADNVMRAVTVVVVGAMLSAIAFFASKAP
jgi:DNA polymerase II small subunit/DNA polymerase delta subunit B